MTEDNNSMMSDAVRPAPRGDVTILVVDDEELIRSLAAHALTDAGFQVLTASSGEECLRLHRENANAIALTMIDFAMPQGINGEQTFDALLEVNPDAKVLLSCGSIPPPALSRMMQKGLSGFITKPYTPRRLVDEVRRILGERDL